MGEAVHSPDGLRPGIERIRLNMFIPVLCREPYRLFFPIGIWMGMVGVAPWLFYALGLRETYSGFFHSSTQMLVYMSCFVTGFLMTFIPRFTAMAYATVNEIFSFLFLLVGISVFLQLEQWIMAETCYLIWLLLLVRFVLVRRPQHPMTTTAPTPPVELIWLPFAAFHGLSGTLLLILGQLDILPRVAVRIGKPMMEQGFLLSMVMGIGGFLLPRIMGTYQHHQAGSQERQIPCAVAQRRSSHPFRSVIFHLGCGLALWTSFWLEGWGWISWGYGMRAIVIIAEFFWTKTLPHLQKGADFYKVLALSSAWMIVAGYGLAAIFSEYRVAMLHLAFMGGFSLLTLAIGTMVILSHAGEADRLKRPMGILLIVAIGSALALVKRTLLIAFPDSYFTFLGLSSLAWIFAVGSWLIYMISRLFKVPEEDAFEKMHQEAQETL